MGGGMMRGYKIMANGGDTDPPKKGKKPAANPDAKYYVSKGTHFDGSEYTMEDKAARGFLNKMKDGLPKEDRMDFEKKIMERRLEGLSLDEVAKAFSKEFQEMEMGGKLKMVENEKGDKVPFYAADGKGKMEMGGKMRGYKMMEEGGETDPPKKYSGEKYSFVQQAVIDGTLPTDKASLKKLIETASKEKRQTVEVGDATGYLMWTASEEGKEYDGLTGISEKGSASAANYYDKIINMAQEKINSMDKGEEDAPMYKTGEFEEIFEKEVEKGRSFDEIEETIKGERGYKF